MPSIGQPGCSGRWGVFWSHVLGCGSSSFRSLAVIEGDLEPPWHPGPLGLLGIAQRPPSWKSDFDLLVPSIGGPGCSVRSGPFGFLVGGGHSSGIWALLSLATGLDTFPLVAVMESWRFGRFGSGSSWSSVRSLLRRVTRMLGFWLGPSGPHLDSSGLPRGAFGSRLSASFVPAPNRTREGSRRDGSWSLGPSTPAVLSVFSCLSAIEGKVCGDGGGFSRLRVR